MSKIQIDKEALKKAGASGTKSALHNMLLLIRRPIVLFLRFLLLLIGLSVLIEWSFWSVIGGILAFVAYVVIMTFYDYILAKTRPEGTMDFLEY